MPQKNLKQTAVSGMIWTALQRYSTMLIQFISGIILARLLTPHDYGCIGMLMIFMVMAESFIDEQMSLSSLVHKAPFPSVKAISEDSFQNGSRERPYQTFWYLNKKLRTSFL